MQLGISHCAGRIINFLFYRYSTHMKSLSLLWGQYLYIPRFYQGTLKPKNGIYG